MPWSWNTIADRGDDGSAWRIANVPSVGSTRPETTRRKVDFPQPDGPTMERNSPSATDRCSGPMACTVPVLVANERTSPVASIFGGPDRPDAGVSGPETVLGSGVLVVTVMGPPWVAGGSGRRGVSVVIGSE